MLESVNKLKNLENFGFYNFLLLLLLNYMHILFKIKVEVKESANFALGSTSEHCLFFI